MRRTLLGAKGIATRSKKLLGAPGHTTRSKDATITRSITPPKHRADLEKSQSRVCWPEAMRGSPLDSWTDPA